MLFYYWFDRRMRKLKVPLLPIFPSSRSLSILTWCLDVLVHFLKCIIIGADILFIVDRDSLSVSSVVFLLSHGISSLVLLISTGFFILAVCDIV